MPKFFGFANTSKGQQIFVPLTETIRHQAENTLDALCKREKLGYGGVFPDKSTLRQPSPMQKRFANGDLTPRKKGRGKR
ncbi:hypothetical protein BC351_01160 [Paenibacillus ferrarius]|uniref:Uncharacterized protein n=1 Tax=Paenibacillus ferrarius TaxID=1469647 RepID=A0A1V4HSI2_9BACL|nr:hypothetical protein [Paenibacillus ferrarius]OPH61880.1 hypothetical protein BC351_01160 [Paenibacillus ferrarius]